MAQLPARVARSKGGTHVADGRKWAGTSAMGGVASLVQLPLPALLEIWSTAKLRQSPESRERGAKKSPSRSKLIGRQ